MTDYVDLHSHTLASGHAYNTIMEMASAAKDKNLKIYGITEHGPMMPGTCSELYFLNYKAVDRSVFPVELLLGVELNILDSNGKVDLKNDLLKRQDVTIASLHVPTIKGLDKDGYTSAIVNAMKNPLINFIGHPDDGRFPIDYKAIVDASKETGTLLEVNNSSLLPNAPRKGARENYEILLKLCREKNVPVVMGSDAHFCTAVGEHSMAEQLIKETDFPVELVLNYFPEKLKKYLNKYK